MSHSIASPARARLPERTEMQLKADLRKADTARDPLADRRIVGRAIQRARSLLGWSLKQLAGAVDRDPRQVARWEAGDDRERAPIDLLWGVAEFRKPLVIALAEATDDSGVQVITQISIRTRKAG